MFLRAQHYKIKLITYINKIPVFTDKNTTVCSGRNLNVMHNHIDDTNVNITRPIMKEYLLSFDCK